MQFDSIPCIFLYQQPLLPSINNLKKMAPRHQRFILLINLKQGTVRSVLSTPITPPSTPATPDDIKYQPDQVVESVIKLLGKAKKPTVSRRKTSIKSKKSAPKRKRFVLRISMKPCLRIESFQV